MALPLAAIAIRLAVSSAVRGRAAGTFATSARCHLFATSAVRAVLKSRIEGIPNRLRHLAPERTGETRRSIGIEFDGSTEGPWNVQCDIPHIGVISLYATTPYSVYIDMSRVANAFRNECDLLIFQANQAYNTIFLRCLS